MPSAPSKYATTFGVTKTASFTFALRGKQATNAELEAAEKARQEAEKLAAVERARHDAATEQAWVSLSASMLWMGGVASSMDIVSEPSVGRESILTAASESQLNVDEIVNSRINTELEDPNTGELDLLQYLVRWEDHDEGETWESYENVVSAPVCVRDFHKKYEEKPGPHPSFLQAED